MTNFSPGGRIASVFISGLASPSRSFKTQGRKEFVPIDTDGIHLALAYQELPLSR